VYAIGIDEDKRRVLVVFRGAITKQDWNKAFSSQFSYAPNPIEEDFEDKSAEIDMHRGFYEYLFRVRKDTHTTKFDEIAGIAHRYGMDRLGPDYKLAVVGHSLGAALSTVFGFWASADARFTKNGPVKIFNFGSPMVGGQRFADCVRHQEKTGKLRLVRFYNHNDVVAHAPFNVKFNKVRENCCYSLQKFSCGATHSRFFFCDFIARYQLSACWRWSSGTAPTDSVLQG
jgi:predicted lipase